MFNQLWCRRAIELLVDRSFIPFIAMSQTHLPLMRVTRDLERLSDVSHGTLLAGTAAFASSSVAYPEHFLKYADRRSNRSIECRIDIESIMSNCRSIDIDRVKMMIDMIEIEIESINRIDQID